MQNIKEYWEKATPMKFDDEKWSCEKKRQFRYTLQNYMQGVFFLPYYWKGKHVLEFGCGSGIDAVEFASYGAKVTAVDLTDSAVELTRSLALEANVDIEVLKTSNTALPFSNNTFDCVYSFGVLHHIPEVEKTLVELQRVLRPGGSVMAMVYNKNSLLNAYSIEYLHREESGDLASKYSERNIGCPYTKLYTVDEARAMFSWWFKDVVVKTYYGVIDTKEQRKIKVQAPKELGWHLVVKGTK
jgi:ubiquinone/menaquinone biosynthesis C-methylase UbiE